MTLRAVISLLLISTTSACVVTAAGSEQDGGRVVNVKKFGARGNGSADDTAAIQAAFNTVTKGGHILSSRNL
jgi:polygalacturonase